MINDEIFKTIKEIQETLIYYVSVGKNFGLYYKLGCLDYIIKNINLLKDNKIDIFEDTCNYCNKERKKLIDKI